VSSQLPSLTKPQATVLALWSYGMVLARSCALTAVVGLLAPLLKIKDHTLRQRLREWCYDAQDKKGVQRKSLDITTCFTPLLRWILSNWSSLQLALAMDATTLGDRFVVLVLSVVYRGCAIPVAWTVLPATSPHAWREEWLRLLSLLKPAVPESMTVIVLADRGLYARWLFQHIVTLGWHPFLRINASAKFRPTGWSHFYWLSHFTPTEGRWWRGQGAAFACPDCRLACTLLARWEPGYSEPWFILTDLPPEASDACWYGLRAWIEQGFKFTKRAGWQWHRTRMTDPRRAERLWLAVAVATLWLLSVGGQADERIPDSTLWDVTASLAQAPRQRQETRLRLVSLFRQGWVTILVALLTGDPLPLPGAFHPEPWAAIPQPFTDDTALVEPPYDDAA
jgi:hypothetical protein